MLYWRKLTTAVVGGLVITAAVHADMIPVSRLDAGRRQSSRVCGRTDLPYTNLASPFNYSSVADLGSWSVEFLPEANRDVGQTYETQPVHILNSGASSLDLCLYALFGLGLCTYLPRAKNLSLGFIPEWYHDGGPFQIGHSYAVMPESLCPVPVCCFIQPVCTVEDSLPQYRLGTVTFLWRKSQFTPTILAPRGPPDLTCQTDCFPRARTVL